MGGVAMHLWIALKYVNIDKISKERGCISDIYILDILVLTH